jgi:hypothetical protein
VNWPGGMERVRLIKHQHDTMCRRSAQTLLVARIWLLAVRMMFSIELRSAFCHGR